MSAPEIFEREIDGVVQNVESVTAFLGVFKDGVKSWIFAVDWNGKKRAAFQDVEMARRWCRSADQVRAGLPKTNPEMKAFNQALKERGWRVVQLIGECPVWEGSAVIDPRSARAEGAAS
jgi:hypothetical protein